MKKKKTSPKHSHAVSQGFWTPSRLLLSIVGLSLLAAIGVSSCSSGDEVASNPPAAPAVKQPVNPRTAVPPPPAITSLPSTVLGAALPAVTGNEFKLADYSGKVVLVNLWATWCGPCRMETPELVKIHKEFHSKGLEMVGLSTENPEASAESVKNFVRDYKVDYKIGWATPEVAMTFMQLTGRNAIPQSFLIAPDGRILNRFVGFSSASTPDQLRQAIEQALSGNKTD
jgi:thiol-disulfide isomerase/thioredoxin